MARAREISVSSSREMSTARLAPPDAFIVVEEDGEEIRYPIPSRVDVDEMVVMYELEKRLHDRELSTEEFMQGLVEAKRFVMAKVRERTPDAPDLKLLPEHIAGVLALMSGSPRVEDALRESMAIVDEELEQALAENDEGDGDARPLASKRTSSPRSRGSGTTAAGARSGGGASPGARSSSRSKPRTGR